jgi:hypothetical protein
MRYTSELKNGGQMRKYRKAILVGVALGLPIWLCFTRWYTPFPSIDDIYGAHFEWDSAHGFKVLKIQDFIDARVGGRVWQSLVAAQIKPRLDSYLRQLPRNRVNGLALVKVTKVIPIAMAESWGTGGLEVADPDTTPLTKAAEAGDAGSVEKLIAARADVNAKDWWGRTPLIHAFDHGVKHEIVEELVAAGADVNAHDNGGNTPLLLAVLPLKSDDQILIIRELLAAHANVNAQDVGGETPLMAAAAWGNIQVVKLLLAAGADPNIRNHNGDTALSTLKSSGIKVETTQQTEVTRLLREAGARE